MGGWRCDEPRDGECVWNYCDEGGYWEPTPIEPELEAIVGCIYEMLAEGLVTQPVARLKCEQVLAVLLGENGAAETMALAFR